MRAYHLAVVLIAISASPLEADWQYTKWGMSVKQVAEASNGAAKKNNDTMLNGEGFKTELVAPYRSGPFGFQAAFRFKQAQGLSSIELKANNSTECPAIKNALVKKYGGPHDSAPNIGLLKWWDRPSGNIVIAYSVGDNYCAVSYQPIALPGASEGL